MKKDPANDSKPRELNEYHQARNKRMVRKVSEQPLMSPEESIEQIQRLAQQSTQALVKSGSR